MDKAIKQHGYLLTAYSKYGAVGADELINLWVNEYVEADVYEVLNIYNEYLDNSGAYTYYYTNEEETLNELLTGKSPLEILRLGLMGKYNYCDEFLFFNGYGNINTISAPALEKEINKDAEFKKHYLLNVIFSDKEEFLQEVEADKIINYCNELLKKGY